jgi:hypothetical protein
MERAATEVETELLDLSGATLEDLDACDDAFLLAARRLLDIVQAPPTVANASSTGNGCN